MSSIQPTCKKLRLLCSLSWAAQEYVAEMTNDKSVKLRSTVLPNRAGLPVYAVFSSDAAWVKHAPRYVQFSDTALSACTSSYWSRHDGRCGFRGWAALSCLPSFPYSVTRAHATPHLENPAMTSFCILFGMAFRSLNDLAPSCPFEFTASHFFQVRKATDSNAQFTLGHCSLIGWLLLIVKVSRRPALP